MYACMYVCMCVCVRVCMYVCVYIYEGWYEIMPLIFVRKYNCIYDEIYVYYGHILRRFEIIFPQSLLQYQHTFSTFA